VIAPVLIGQGVIQNLKPYTTVTTWQHGQTPRLIAQGPVASQEVIKELGTNGGGFFAPIARTPLKTRPPSATSLRSN
jgi:K+-transporting ATPase ATPase A chain